MTAEAFLASLWEDYLAATPSARRIHALLEARGERLVNDHIALRTFEYPGLTLESLAAPFLDWGYRDAEEDYRFPAKRLRARHYEHPAGLPKIFISELQHEAFSAPFRAVLDRCAASPAPGTSALDLYRGGRPWSLAREEYRLLAAESEYAAWVAALGYRPNHFTISFNHLETFDELAALKGEGFTLNTAGGEIEGSGYRTDKGPFRSRHPR